MRARVTDRFERKGHEFVDLRVLYLVDGAPVALCDHRAIWQPRVLHRLTSRRIVPASATATVVICRTTR